MTMTTTGGCMTCHRVRERAMVEITGFGDPEPRFMDGAWEVCTCGDLSQVVAGRAPYLGAVHGPPVPTPEDITEQATHILARLYALE